MENEEGIWVERFRLSVFCPDCEAGRTAALERMGIMLKISDLPEDVAKYNLASFRKFPNRREVEPLLAAIGELLEHGVTNFKGDTYRGVWIFGQFGVGKTRLLQATLHEFIRRGYPGRYLSWGSFLDKMRSAMDDESRDIHKVTAANLFHAALNTKVLVVDELGAESKQKTEWARDKLYQLLDFRASRPNLITFFSSNQEPHIVISELTEGDDSEAGRLRSRFSAVALPMMFTGKDLRSANRFYGQ